VRAQVARSMFHTPGTAEFRAHESLPTSCRAVLFVLQRPKWPLCTAPAAACPCPPPPRPQHLNSRPIASHPSTHYPHALLRCSTPEDHMQSDLPPNPMNQVRVHCGAGCPGGTTGLSGLTRVRVGHIPTRLPFPAGACIGSCY